MPYSHLGPRVARYYGGWWRPQPLSYYYGRYVRPWDSPAVVAIDPTAVLPNLDATCASWSVTSRIEKLERIATRLTYPNQPVVFRGGIAFYSNLSLAGKQAAESVMTTLDRHCLQAII